jgi:hypothetical protein
LALLIVRFADAEPMTDPKEYAELFAATKVLVVDDERYMRKV